MAMQYTTMMTRTEPNTLAPTIMPIKNQSVVSVNATGTGVDVAITVAIGSIGVIGVIGSIGVIGVVVYE